MGLLKPRKVIQRTVAEVIDHAMRTVKGQFPPGAKLTLVIRSDMLEGPLVFTNDTPEDAIGAIRTLSTQPGAVTVAE